MRHVRAYVSVALSAALSIGVCAAASDAGPTEPAVWQHHQELIDYYGVTETYTCTGIEDKMRQLLLYLGARRADLKITPLCSRQLAPMQQVFVRVDFYSLAPATEGSGEALTAHWAPLSITPRDALFRDRAECELFQNVKKVLTKDFTIRDVHYDTTCTPYDTTLQDYNITGEILAPPDPQRASSQ
jgi:hypothetical protein